VKLWKLVLATAGIIAICLLCGMPVWGAQPRADVLTFTGSTDGKAVTQTPSVAADIRVNPNVPTIPNVTNYTAAVIVGGLPKLVDFTVTVTIKDSPNPPGPNPPPPVIWPSTELRILVEPVKTILAVHPQRADFAAFCKTTAETLEKGGTALIGTAEALRDYNTRAVTARFKDVFTKAPGLAEAMNKAMLGWVGAQTGALTPERFAKAVECYKAFVWAAGG